MASPTVSTHNPTPTGDQGTTVNYSEVSGDGTVDQAAKQISESEATGYHDHVRTESPELAGLFTVSDDLIDDTAVGLSEPVFKVELDNREDSARLVSEFDSGAVLGSKEESSCHHVRQTSIEEKESVYKTDVHVSSVLNAEEENRSLCASGVSEKILTTEDGAGERGEEGGSEGGGGEGGGEEGGDGEGGGEGGGGDADGRLEIGDQDAATSSCNIVPGATETANGKKLSLSSSIHG